MPRFMAMCTKEAGKTLADGVAEVREAVDFLRYYALQARELFPAAALPGPTGESNTLQLAGRGVFVCISPWNFPLAIFLGQVAAALAAGNTVIAKPAEQTNLIGFAAVQLMHEAGVPRDVLQYLPGDGATVAAHLDPTRARAAAQAYLAAAGVTGTVAATVTEVTVTVTITYHTRLLSMIGVTSFDVHGTATARPVPGLITPEGS